jgi:hypothetical protein
VPPLGLSEGGLVSDKGDWALVVVVGAAAAAVCPRSCKQQEELFNYLFKCQAFVVSST